MHDQARNSITFFIDSQPNQISLIRAALSGILRHLDVMEADVFSLELAATELINNILEHGYKGASDRRVEVNFSMVASEVRIELKDSAPPFPDDQLYRLRSPKQPIEDASEQWPMRGHGLQIIRQIVDSIEITSEKNGNHMIITKKITREDGSIY